MKVDKKLGSSGAKIYIEDDGNYFQVSAVGSSSADLTHISLLCPATSTGTMGLPYLDSSFSLIGFTDSWGVWESREGSLGR